VKLREICRKSNIEKRKSKDDIWFQDGGWMCRKSNIEKRKKLTKKQRRHLFPRWRMDVPRGTGWLESM
jgi:hypothetical protein